jgi:hypothetical protein
MNNDSCSSYIYISFSIYYPYASEINQKTELIFFINFHLILTYATLLHLFVATSGNVYDVDPLSLAVFMIYVVTLPWARKV